jgi:hypothetical protein
MALLKKLKSLFAPAGDGRSYWFYVRCDKCGEVLRGRADLMNDLSPQYDDGSLSYFCRKVLIGSQGCYAPIEVELHFDKNRKLTSREISGGRFATEEDYAPKNAG